MLQLRLERHVEQQQMEELAQLQVDKGSQWRQGIPGMRNQQLVLACLLWSHAAFDRWQPHETSASAALMSFLHLCSVYRLAHALHFLASLDDAVLLRLPSLELSIDYLLVARGGTASSAAHGLAAQLKARLAIDGEWAVRNSSDEALQREVLNSMRGWIGEMRSFFAPHLLESAILQTRNFASHCLLLMEPLTEGLTARINLAERFNGGQALLSRMLCELDSVNGGVLRPLETPPTEWMLQLLLNRLEQRIRAQSDEQLERDGAFAAVAAMCCEVSLPVGSPAHSVADHLLDRMSRRWLASGCSSFCAPSFTWSELLGRSHFSPMASPEFALTLRPTVRLLWSHGLTVSYAGIDYCISALEDPNLNNDAAKDLYSTECEEWSTREVDWLSPALAIPPQQDPLINNRPQFLLMEGSSFEEERIRFIESTQAAQPTDPASAPQGVDAAVLPTDASASAVSSALPPSFAVPFDPYAEWHAEMGLLGPTQLTQWIRANEAETAADAILSRPSFNLLSATSLSSPTLSIDRFDLRELPAEHSERLAELGRGSDCFSGAVLHGSLQDCDLMRRLENLIILSPSLRPRLSALQRAASRWYRRCFPQLRAEIVTADERVLRSLPPPSDLSSSASSTAVSSSFGISAPLEPHAGARSACDTAAVQSTAFGESGGAAGPSSTTDHSALPTEINSALSSAAISSQTESGDDTAATGSTPTFAAAVASVASSSSATDASAVSSSLSNASLSSG